MKHSQRDWLTRDKIQLQISCRSRNCLDLLFQYFKVKPCSFSRRSFSRWYTSRCQIMTSNEISVVLWQPETVSTQDSRTIDHSLLQRKLPIWVKTGAPEDKKIRHMNKLLWGKISVILPWNKCEHTGTAHSGVAYVHLFVLFNLKSCSTSSPMTWMKS